jgi:hypothetical protein
MSKVLPSNDIEAKDHLWTDEEIQALKAIDIASLRGKSSRLKESQEA